MLQQVLTHFHPIADALNKGQLNVDEKSVVRQYARNIIIRCGYDPMEVASGETQIDELGVLIDSETNEVRIGEEVFSAPKKVVDLLCQVSGERDELRSLVGHEKAEAVLNDPAEGKGTVPPAEEV